MFHGHSHDGPGGHNHSHSHSHSHLQGSNVGFDDDDADEPGRRMPMRPGMNPMMMGAGGVGGGGGMPMAMMNPAALMAQMPPELMEISKQQFEQRQKLMQEFQAKGGQSNPVAVQEVMAKASQLHQSMLAEVRAKVESGTIPKSHPMIQMMLPQLSGGAGAAGGGAFASAASSSGGGGTGGGPINPMDLLDKEAPVKPVEGLLGANANMSKLDELMNKRGTPSAALAAKKAREEEEQKILDAIAKKEYAQLNAIKATQYGVLERLRELVESGQYDVNQPDHENVYLLHWAAINNRLDIAKYLVKCGAKVDTVGGELETTPLNWAARSGHVHMCVLLMQAGADPLQADIEGFSTLHLASMFGHSNVVAYLLVKGVDVDLRDRNGSTALMHACQRVQSRDPAQLLITFNASLNAQDSKGNTALHYCIAYNNLTCLEILIERGASVDIKNKKNQTAVELALAQKKTSTAAHLRSLRDEKENVPRFLRSFTANKEIRKFFTRLYPFLFLFYFGFAFELSVAWYVKILVMLLFWPISYSFNILFFDNTIQKVIPMAITMSIISFLYATWFIYFRPFVFDFSFYSLSFVVATAFSWYNLYKAYKVDPGVLTANRDQKMLTILKFVEQNEFSLDHFCTSCIIRKPLRSKHCHECDRCIAKFDHHCPWVDNCIGQNNLKYFMGFLFWTPICIMFYVHGAMAYYKNTCYGDDLFLYKRLSPVRLLYQFFICSPWVGFFTLVAIVNLFWIGALFVCHFYQLVFLALTTNERINFKRYKHFFDKDGNYRNPFNFGVLQNFVDLLELRFLCLRPTQINWKKEHDIQDVLNSRFDRKKARYEDV